MSKQQNINSRSKRVNLLTYAKGTFMLAGIEMTWCYLLWVTPALDAQGTTIPKLTGWQFMN